MTGADAPLDRPRLRRHVRLVHDRARSRHVLLAPETLLALTPSAVEVLALCDGERTTGEIVAVLTARHPGAKLAPGVHAVLGRLAARGWLAGFTMHTGASAVAGEASAPGPSASNAPAQPVALLAELTYRCPLRCGYCSNPTDLARYRDELSGEEWARVFGEAAELGALHLHLSGGEPLVRDDLESLVRAGRAAGLYVNLITSAYGLNDARLDALVAAGVDHVQISFQDTSAERGDPIAGTTVHEHKVRMARAVVARGVALSVNVVVHRGNVERVGEIIDLAAGLGAQRLELANAQYHGWALRNRDALLADRASLDRAADAVTAARARLGTQMAVIHVLPDYHTDRPKPCMDGWAQRFVTVTPDGVALPCPGAHALPLPFENVRARSLAAIWHQGEAFRAYRGEDWMREPCRSCDERAKDHGGCRCQAFALTGDARNTDPTCAKSPAHQIVREARARATAPPPELLYRVRTGRGG